MWQHGWREKIWSEIDKPWDVIVIGGGITGAGIFLEAARSGMKVLLVEARDFASGTSSRSSKMVHGGLRYLRNAQIRMTNESVHERERLLKEGRGLIQPLAFLMLNYAHDPIPWWLFGFGLAFYDILARKWSHRRYNASGMLNLCPYINTKQLLGGYRYIDAQTDDARLVLRIIQEAVHLGGVALSYSRVIDLLRDKDGNVSGIVLEDNAPYRHGKNTMIHSRVVINATGAWTDQIRSYIDKPPRIRKLRGSHILFRQDRLPLNRAVTALHPEDARPVYALPWEGTILVGTTDVDHQNADIAEPKISRLEAEYLLSFARHVFPTVNLTTKDALSAFSGIRSVINTGKVDPSKESREHFVLLENGLLTVSGGKLTTFRLMALDALARIKDIFPGKKIGRRVSLFSSTEISEPIPISLSTDLETSGKLFGKLGKSHQAFINFADEEELTRIPGTAILWAELRHAARFEGVVRLEDLLFRRTRIGNILPNGGMEHMDRIKSIMQTELRWNDEIWLKEMKDYRSLYNEKYSLNSLE